MLTVLEAAKRVLEEAGRPLSAREITEAALSKGYWQTSGLTPDQTVHSRLATSLKSPDSPFVRTAPGRFGLKGQAPAYEPPVSDEPLGLFEDEELDPSTESDTLSFTEAALEVLQEATPQGPMHYRDITRIALEKGKLATQGKTPEATMYAQILSEIARYKKRGLDPRFLKLGQGLVALTGAASSVPPKSAWTPEDEALLSRIRGITPDQFEKLVATLCSLVFEANIKQTRMTGDGGIDARGEVELAGGIRCELVAQAKRYTPANVSRPDLQKFRGSMGSQTIGVFITTAGFSRGAVLEARRASAHGLIGLINGHQLVGLMKEHGLKLDGQGDPAIEDEFIPTHTEV